MVKSLIKKHEKLIIYIVLLIITCLIMIPYLTKPAHMSADNYRTAVMGLNNYAYEFSFKDGRFIIYLYNMLLYHLNISMDAYIILSCFLGIVISLIAVMVVMSTIEKIKEPKNKKEKLIVLIISYLMIFNIMYLECFYFVEAPGMALSILFMLLAARQIVFRRSWKNILYAFLFMLLSLFSYQGNVEFFIAFILLNSLLVNKLKWKKAIKDVLLGCAVLFLAGLINLITVKTICNFIGYREDRLPHSISESIDRIKKRGLAFISTPYILQIVFVLILYIFQVSKSIDNKSILSWLAVIILISLMSAAIKILIPTINNTMSRTQFSIGAIVMIGFYFLYCHSDYFTNKYIILVSILLVYLIINTINYASNIYYSKKVNELEKRNAEIILSDIQNYETTNNIVIENMVIVKTLADDDTIQNQIFFDEVPALFDNILTMNSCYTIFCMDSVLTYYGHQPFKNVTKVESEVLDIEFDENEIYKCIDNTLYIKKYYQ